MAMLPSMFGVHIFRHHCLGCNENETVTRIFTTVHSHEHSCAGCTGEGCSHSCGEKTGNNTHQQTHDNSCKHDFKKASFEGQIAVVKFKLEADAIDLLFCNVLQTEVLVNNYQPPKQFSNVILNIPDEPSPEKNCVFLL